MGLTFGNNARADKADIGQQSLASSDSEIVARPSVAEVAAESVQKELVGQMPAAAIPEYVEYTKALAEHLQGIMTNTVTLESLLDAKLKGLEFLVNEGWATRLTNAVLKASGVEDSMLSGMIESAISMLPGMIEQMKMLLEDVPAFLKAQGVSEQQILSSDKVGLNPDNLQKYNAGTLTIGDLFMTQPSVIIKNS